MPSWIYIAVHRVGSNVKVGQTTRDPEERIRKYSEAYDLDGFQFHKKYPVPENSRHEVERLAHKNLRKYRLGGISNKNSNAREIFVCSAEVAEGAVEKAKSESAKYQQLKKEFEAEQRRKAAEPEQEKLRQIEKEKVLHSAELAWASSEENKYFQVRSTGYGTKSTGSMGGWLCFGFVAFLAFRGHFIAPLQCTSSALSIGTSITS